jgi:hypothetical protein
MSRRRGKHDARPRRRRLGDDAVTEREWLECADPHKMLRHLQGRASSRKLRLFAVACCQRFPHLLGSEPYKVALEIAERLADQFLPQEQVHPCIIALMGVEGPSVAADAVGNAVRFAVDYRIKRDSLRYYSWDAGRVAYWTSQAAYAVAAEQSNDATRWFAAQDAEHRWQADTLREIFKPFRRVATDPTWLAWNRGAVAALAQTIYEERRFEDMPFLADALEEAGCKKTTILSHCRGENQHVRGCWVLDLLLGKN